MEMDKKVRITKWNFLDDGSSKKYFEFAGPSSASKPDDVSICTGSLFHEVDTTKVYAWDESAETWYEQCKLGGDE